MKTLFLDDQECSLFREMLDFVPLKPRYIAFVVDLLQRIPEPEAGSAPSSGSAPPAVHSSPTGGGFQLIARNPKNQAALESIFRRLPHGGDL